MATNRRTPDEGRFVRPEFDPSSGRFQVYHDTDWSWNATTTLVYSLSSLTNVGPLEMRPLYGVVDPDVLDTHVQGRARGAKLTFDFYGYRVAVRDTGHITFLPLDDLDA